MTPRELIIRTLRHQPVDRIPRNLWALPGVAMFRRSEIDRLSQRFPSDIQGPKVSYGKSSRARGTPAEVGEYTDAWGCGWHVAEPGVAGEVKYFPLADWSALASYRPPLELLDQADFSQVNASCAESSHFMLSGTETRPFERLQFLRGTENLFLDLAFDPPELRQAIAMLHDFFCREMTLWAQTDIDGVSFMDDWGSQTSLLISPETWRSLFKPLYRDYCSILHAHGKFAFFHSDGYIEDIYPDLVEIGVDAVNSQLFCMDIESLGRRFAGRITFWGEIDRQHILPFGSTTDVRNAVRRVRRALDHGTGGVIAQCEWGMQTPYENIEAVYDEWNRDHPDKQDL